MPTRSTALLQGTLDLLIRRRLPPERCTGSGCRGGFRRTHERDLRRPAWIARFPLSTGSRKLDG